jgi:hypothetical protein
MVVTPSCYPARVENQADKVLRSALTHQMERTRGAFTVASAYAGAEWGPPSVVLPLVSWPGGRIRIRAVRCSRLAPGLEWTRMAGLATNGILTLPSWSSATFVSPPGPLTDPKGRKIGEKILQTSSHPQHLNREHRTRELRLGSSLLVVPLLLEPLLAILGAASLNSTGEIRSEGRR